MPQGQTSQVDNLYTGLDAETRIMVQQRTSEIKTLMRRSAQDIVEIGQKLIEVKAQLGRGLFSAWLRIEFEWSRGTAENFMAVALRFQNQKFSDFDVAPSALYMLAAPSTPESARDEVLRRAESGERITFSTAQEVIREHKSTPSAQDRRTQQRQAETGCDTASVSVLPARRGSDVGEPLHPSFRHGQVVECASEPPPVASRAEVVLPSAYVPISETPDYDSDEWYTPAEYIEAARAVMGDIDLDPATCAAAQEMIRARTFLTKEDDGLTRPWHGRVWLNPPYSGSLVQGFVDRLCIEYDAGRMTEAVVLVNNATDTAWFHSLLARFPACVLRRRVPFWRPGFSGGGARQGQAVFYLGPNAHRFRAVFSRFGVVVAVLPRVEVTDKES